MVKLFLIFLLLTGCQRSDIISTYTACNCSDYDYPVKEHVIQEVRKNCTNNKFLYSAYESHDCICSISSKKRIGTVYKINIRCLEK